MKLTSAQVIAHSKLTDKWLSAFDLKCSLNTLRALTKKGFAESKNDSGFLSLPRHCIYFRRKAQ
jgi:hypothetical protein